MSEPVRLTPERPGVINEIPIGCVCANARFVFDRPVQMQDHNRIEMIDGQFWLIDGKDRYFLDGKWSL